MIAPLQPDSTRLALGQRLYQALSTVLQPDAYSSDGRESRQITTARTRTPPSRLQTIERAPSVARGLMDMGINHRGLQITVTKQQLDGSNVRTLG